MVTKRTIKIRGKPVVFSSRRLKDGTIAYYRAGKRRHSKSQIRITRGVLAGQSLQQASGHAPPAVRQARREIQSRAPMNTDGLQRVGPRGVEKWGRSFRSAQSTRTYDWYAQVEVLAFKELMYDLEDVEPDQTKTVTILLVRGIGPNELASNRESIVQQALDSYGLTPANADAVTAIWRKKD